MCAAQRSLDRAGQPASQPPVGIGLAASVEHQQIVERHAVARGVDARVDDVRAGRGEARADPVEQAFAVRREDADPGRPAVGIVLDDDARLGLADPRFGRGHLAGVGDLPGKRLGQPVAVGQPPRMGPRPRSLSSRARPPAPSAAPRPARPGHAACGRAEAAPRPLRTGSAASVRFHSFQMPGPTARMSTTVRISSRRSRSGLCTWWTKSSIVLGSARSRLNAVDDSSR